MKRGYHLFEMIDSNTTKYTNISNSDPHLKYVHKWVINHMAKTYCHKFLELVT